MRGAAADSLATRKETESYKKKIQEKPLNNIQLIWKLSIEANRLPSFLPWDLNHHWIVEEENNFNNN